VALPDDPTKVTQADLVHLISERQSEGQRLDFKGALPTAWNDKAKNDLQSDVAAFANATGGYLVFGMEQDADGCAAKLVPQAFNPDTDAMRVESILGDGVEPRMPGCKVQPVPVDVDGTTGYAILVYVPQSWVGPHRVKSSRHFYLRDGLQSRPVDVPELRSMFIRSESQAERVRAFRTERLSKVMTGETPYKLAEGPVLVLHLIPLQAVLGQVSVGPVQYLGLRRGIPVVAANSGAVMSLVNLDGAAGTRNMLEKGTNGYTLLFRNGFIETTWVLSSNSAEYKAVLPGGAYEDYIAQFVTAARSEMAHWGITGQVVSMFSIIGADDVTLAIQREYGGHEAGKFDRKVLALPDVELAGEASEREELKPLFDLVWQSAGFHGSPNFDDHGRWVGPRR